MYWLLWYIRYRSLLNPYENEKLGGGGGGSKNSSTVCVLGRFITYW